ncbi:hypothetical protein GYMLUDRAFT_55538 [Collybiopsis luxurians FD-317 M1]|nr:hypothetical protein GYMLUDRAFT_55538 [Collybiopsis luxurians FD-317 M1]
MIIHDPLPESELQRRMAVLAHEYQQSVYTGSASENVDNFLNEIEHNFQMAGIPRSQWMDVALHFMASEPRAVMREHKQKIRSREDNEHKHWVVFKTLLRQCHATAQNEANFQRQMTLLAHRYQQSTYTGSTGENVDNFLNEIEHNCQMAGIPRSQWIDVALHFMAPRPRAVMHEHKQTIYSTEKGQHEHWAVFKDVLRELHTAAQNAPNDSQDPFLEAARQGIAVAGVTYAVGPSVILGALNVVGFSASGVLGGSLAATAQSIFYGGATSGVFSTLQSIAATGVVASAPVLALGAGAVGLAFGAGFYLFNHRRQE